MMTDTVGTDSLFQVENTTFFFPSKLICQFFGVSRETLNNWKVTPTFPTAAISASGSYDLKAIYQWRMSIDGGQEFNERKLIADTKAKEARARRAEIELGQIEGSMISRDEVIERSTRKINEVKTALLTLPKQLPAALSGRDEREWASIIYRNVEIILKRFSGQ